MSPPNTPTTAPRLALTLNEAAKSIGLSRRSTWTLLNSGQMPGTKIGGKWIVPVAALQQWLAERAAEHTAGVR